jgi:hypothetical protein
MGIQIEDGKGRGYCASVDSKNYLKTNSFQRREIVLASNDGDAYAISSAFLSLTTTDTNTGILYIKNTAPETFFLDEIIVSSNGVYTKWTIVRNPTTGTLISAGTSIEPVNLNFGSGATFTGICKAGADAKTITDGINATMLMSSMNTRIQTAEAVILQKGNSLGIVANVPSAAIVIATVTGYYHTVAGNNH